MIGLEADLSQVESRIVFMLSGDPELQRLANLPAYEYDVHSNNAALLFHGGNMAAFEAFQKSDPKTAKMQRHTGKCVSHGAQRDMRGAKLSDTILKQQNTLIAAETCDGWLNTYHRKHDAIKGRYFPDVRKTIMRDRMLMNSHGRIIDFRYDRLDDEIFRQGYSFWPQSENADHLSEFGLYPFWAWLKDVMNRPPNVQVHDSLYASITWDVAYAAAKFLERSLARPIMLGGKSLIVPVEFKLGINWGADEKAGDGVEFKRLPSEDEFTHAAWELEKERRRRG